MLQAQERVSCSNCGEQKAPDKVCGHCAEDL
jgi:ribosomal protein L32